MYQQSRSAYQTAAVNGATQAGLLQLVYTRLAQDFLRAAEAVRQNKIGERCTASNHALLLLGHLESWIPDLGDPKLAESLAAFYAMLRASVLQLQATLDAAKFEECAQLVLQMRAAWQAKEDNLLTAAGSVAAAPRPAPGSLSFHA